MERFAKLLDETLQFEMDLHRGLCAEFGISRQDLERTRPAPTCLAYTSYLLRVAYEGEAATLLAALLPCSWGYGEIGLRLQVRGLPDHAHPAKWIETYASNEYQASTRTSNDSKFLSKGSEVFGWREFLLGGTDAIEVQRVQ